MEQPNIVLRGIAQGLNAVGSALVFVYDAAASTVSQVLPGEKEKLKGKIKEYEKKIERLYFDIGKEVSKEEDRVEVSAVGEAGLKLIAEYRNEIKKIKQGLQEIEEAEKIARQQALQKRESGQKLKRPEAKEPVMTSEKSAPGEEIAQEAEPGVPAEPPLAEGPVAGGPSPEAGMEEEKPVETQESEPPQEALLEEASAEEMPVAGSPSPEAETEEEKPAEAQESETLPEELRKGTPEGLEIMLKVDLLALGTEKGIEVDRRMTKAEIIELILNHQG
jgi:molybdenum-dependent DNA-binding transcriptional regulator ModE